MKAINNVTDNYQLISILSTIITFVRVSSGKGHLEMENDGEQLAIIWKQRHRVSLFLIPWIVRISILKVWIVRLISKIDIHSIVYSLVYCNDTT